MESVPWTKLMGDHKDIFVKYAFEPTSYNVMATDLIFIYGEKLEEEEIQERFCLLNPYAEMNTKSIISNIKQCMEQFVSGNSSTNNILSFPARTDETVKLKLEFVVAHISLVWEFNMAHLNPHNMLVHVLEPIMYIANDRNKRCQELMKIIFDKDKEIEEHRAGGSKTRKQTDIFNQKIFFGTEYNTKLELNNNMRDIVTVYEDLYHTVLSCKERTHLKHSTTLPDHSEDGKTDCTENLESTVPVPIKKIKSEVSEKVEQTALPTKPYNPYNEANEKKPPILLQQQLDVKIKKKKKIIKF